MLRVQGDALDQARLRHWAEQLDVTDLLDQARAAAAKA